MTCIVVRMTSKLLASGEPPGMNNSTEKRSYPGRWGVLLAMPAVALFLPIAFQCRKFLGVPPPRQGAFDRVPRDVPEEYWWAWSIAFLVVFSIGLTLMAFRRTRRIGIAYLILVVVLTTPQMLAVKSHEYHRWDNGDSRQFSPHGQAPLTDQPPPAPVGEGHAARGHL